MNIFGNIVEKLNHYAKEVGQAITGQPAQAKPAPADDTSAKSGGGAASPAASGGSAALSQVDVEQVLEPIYAEHKRPRPPYRTDLLNHDIWYCRAVSPCEYCRSKQAAGNGA